MEIFVKIDPIEESYTAISDVSLFPRAGFTRIEDADLRAKNEALTVFAFDDEKAARKFGDAMRTLAHEWVFGTWEDAQTSRKAFIVWFVDGSSSCGGDHCRKPGLHYLNFRA